MKKAIIIANILFVSMNVFGMDQKMKDKLYAAFETAQSLVKSNEIFSEDAKLLYSNLKFKNILKEIERIFFSDLSLENARQTSSDIKDVSLHLEQMFGKTSSEVERIKSLLNSPEASFRRIVKGSKFGDSFRQKALESSAKRGAKLFYKQVLGSSKLGKDLYEVAVQEIDSAKCIQGLDLKSFIHSINSVENGIKCTYYNYDDLLLVLVHETGHSLDWFYRIRKTLEQPKAMEVFKNKSDFLLEIASFNHGEEYVSVFFEFLLFECSKFRGNLYPKDSSAHRFGLIDIYRNFIKKSVESEIIVAYEKGQLEELLYKNDSDAFLQKMRKHKILQQYLEILLEPQEIFYENTDYDDIIRRKKTLWDNLLYTLDSKGYKDLSQYFCDVDKGKRKILCSRLTLRGVVELFRFSKNLLEEEVSQREETLEIVEVSPPELEGIDWNEIDDIIWAKGRRFESIVGSYMWKVNLMKDINLDQKIEDIKNLDIHIEGRYNAFCLEKEKGYFGLLESGKSLPIEEVMKELTKPRGALKLTEELVKEFLEFLKKRPFKNEVQQYNVSMERE